MSSGRSHRQDNGDTDAVKPLPGSRPGTPAGMAQYLVLLKDDVDDGAEAKGRREVYESGLARIAQFQHRLRRWLDEQGMGTQVGAIGEPVAFPLVTLTATPAVAKMIESLPEVASVVPDSDDLGLVR